jgi:import receptor subunit TOM22
MNEGGNRTPDEKGDTVEFGLEEPNARMMMANMGGRGDHPHSDDEDDDHLEGDDEDETLGERLIGLTEMLPESVRKVTSGVLGWTWESGKWLLHVGRVGLWVAASSATILALPVMFESERTQMEEQQLNQQRQLMLGPNAAMSGAGHGMMHSGAFPQVAPP